MFGTLLGTGEYGHLIIEHVPMLMRSFGSMREFNKVLKAPIKLIVDFINKQQITIFIKRTHQVGCF